MSKAEEIALSKYPVLKTELGDINYLPRIGFIEGYSRAEKGNQLTWEDIKRVIEIADKLVSDNVNELIDNGEEWYYKEVLKRFKELKENNEKK